MVKGRNTTYVGVRLPDELASRLRSEARKHKLSFSDYLRSILSNNWKLPDTVFEPQFTDDSELPPDLDKNPDYWKSLDLKPEVKYPGTPRNAPCPCGSGKKYKKCHGL